MEKKYIIIVQDIQQKQQKHQALLFLNEFIVQEKNDLDEIIETAKKYLKTKGYE